MLIFTGVILMAMLCVSVLAFIVPPAHEYSKDIVSKLYTPVIMLDSASILALNKELNTYGKLSNTP